MGGKDFFFAAHFLFYMKIREVERACYGDWSKKLCR